MTGTAIAYAMSDMGPGEEIEAGTISVPADKGGCGYEHHIQVNDDQRPYIDCPGCGAYMVAHHYGWSNTPNGVPLTCDEQGEVEISKRDGETSYRLAMKAMGDAVGQIVQGGRSANQAPAQLSLAEQLAALTPSEKAEITAMLAPPAAAGSSPHAADADHVHPAPVPPEPAWPDAGHTHPVAATPAPEKPAPRKPGRPRKIAD